MKVKIANRLYAMNKKEYQGLLKIAGEQVEVYINDKYVAKGEVIVIEDKFGIRVTNTNVQQKIYLEYFLYFY